MFREQSCKTQIWVAGILFQLEVSCVSQARETELELEPQVRARGQTNGVLCCGDFPGWVL
jgi:hypothetical protein